MLINMSQKKKLTLSKKIKRNAIGAISLLFFRLIAFLPLYLNRFIASIIGHLSWLLSNKTKKVIKTNLELCYPHLSAQSINALCKKNMLENAKLGFEFPLVWLANKARIDSIINHVNNAELLEGYYKKKRPVIIAVPHTGNWEVMWYWLQINYPAFGMYSPIKTPQIDKLILGSRQRFGGEAFATDPKGIMSLMRKLKKNGVMMILTDQVPRDGAGEFAPFFNQPAYTMTLLHRFMQKTGAELLFASCLRNSTNQFDIHLYPSSFNANAETVAEFNQGMNKQIEEIIEVAPEQYQWSYKRFKRHPDGRDVYRSGL
jgi:Kdo2-lipid IVA lauroyltransferase/acyltransferase